ncbi:TonB family protein [Endozoicomonas sp. 8E]|uniref:TonB family protein n=1 Tax=Endozoicomonas sp. 8E TaxID=3035692 RepID=UPI002938DB3A|nr:TonB family protein [Endozoicomonas sp. 8E]WOG29023.1 TonB family protein [Endozoicomonas sp. 8E]
MEQESTIRHLFIPLTLSVVFHTLLLGYTESSWMTAPKTPGIQIKLVSHQPAITPAIEKNLTASEATIGSELTKPDSQFENTERTQTTEKTEQAEKAENKKVITTRAEKKKIQQEPANQEENKHRDAKPVEPPASNLNQQTAGEPVEELINSKAGHLEPDEFQKWVAQLQYRINRYKLYPFQAKRRRLEGEVKIKIEINSDGTLGKATMLAGKKAFKASSMKAIERSLPLPPPRRKPVTVIISINYQLL